MCDNEYPDYEWEAEQDAKAGYVRPDELEGTEHKDNPYFGMAKSFVFLQIWLEDLRGWIPSQDDLRPAWDGKMTGTMMISKLPCPITPRSVSDVRKNKWKRYHKPAKCLRPFRSAERRRMSDGYHPELRPQEVK